MKTAWSALAIVAVLGFLCCAGVFFFGWQAYRLSQRANHGAEQWTNAHFHEVAAHWSLKSWLDQSEPVSDKRKAEIELRLSTYEKEYGDLVSAPPFFATGTFMSTTGRGLEFVVTLLSPKAQFKNKQGDVIVRVRHAMSRFTLEDIKVRAPK